mmetsp:Transcript_3390/g.4931  ORF Transcript_3390/g.4931 Transcript_3390/m.4931 type:complete len:427 (+) Transcript_3390:241-1521(+)
MQVLLQITMSLNILSAAFLHSAHSFTFPTRTQLHKHLQKLTSAAGNKSSFKTISTARCMSTDSSSSVSSINISRLSTLQTLLQKAGAPGSTSCNIPNDLEPVSASAVNLDLHPHLYPIARSSSKPDHYICGLRRAYADDALYESSTNAPWPIVESKVNGMGYNLLSLNSEHMMRRIVAQVDSDRDEGKDTSDSNADAGELIDIYNGDLGMGKVDKAFDALYQPGSVTQLGYGPSKYILLRVGPFPDLYEEMASQHSARNDESSSLIAAEASNGKFTGFGSTFRFYAELLNSFPNRQEEAKDAARVCLRLPLPSIGMHEEDFIRVSEMAGLPSLSSSTPKPPSGKEEAMMRMEEMYEKIKAHEEEDEQAKANMTPEQMAIEDANKLLDRMVFESDRQWSSLREELGSIYGSAGLDEMASFVDPSRSS